MKRVALRAGRTITGFVVLAAGIAMLALPGPGVLCIALGLGLLASEFEWARRLLDRLKSAARHVVPRKP